MQHRTDEYYRERAESLADEYDRADPTYLAQLMTLVAGRKNFKDHASSMLMI